MRALVTTGFCLGLLVAWEGLARAELVGPQFPSPTGAARYLDAALADGSLPRATGLTLGRLLAGYLISVALGLPLGLLAARFELFGLTIGRLAIGLQALPSVCWVPLALLWFGRTEGAVVSVVVMGSLWSVLISAEAGLRAVPSIYSRAARTMGSRGLHTWLFVRFPASLPQVVTGLKQGWAFAWRALMAAEIYVTMLSGLGLGQLLHAGRERSATDQVVGVMLAIGFVGLAFDLLLFAPVSSWIHRRFGLEG